MWCARFYKENHGEYQDVNVNLHFADGLHESTYITMVQNKVTDLFKNELGITHFRLFVVTTQNTEGIPQTKFIKI